MRPEPPPPRPPHTNPLRSSLFIVLIFVFLQEFYSLTSLNSSQYYGYQFGSSGNDYTASIWTDINGNSLLTGNTDGSLFNISSGVQDIFISKHHSSNGSVMWGVQFGTPLPDSGVAVTAHPTLQDSLVTGYTTGKLFESNPFSILWYVNYDAASGFNEQISLCPGDRFIATTIPSYWGSGDRNVENMKLYNSSSQIVVAAQSIRFKFSSQYLLEYQNDELECSNFQLTFPCLYGICRGRIALIQIDRGTTFNETFVDGFLARYNAITGILVWGIQFGARDIDIPAALTTSPSGNDIYVVGSISTTDDPTGYFQTYFITKFNFSDGSTIWDIHGDIYYAPFASSVACDESGWVFVLINDFSDSLRLAKYSSNGNKMWEALPISGNFVGVSILQGTDSILYVSAYRSKNSGLFALNSTDGSLCWQVLTKHQDLVQWSVSQLNNSVYIASTILSAKIPSYHLAKYDVNIKKLLWEINYAPLPDIDILSTYIPASVSINFENKLRLAGSVLGDQYCNSTGGVDNIILSPNICPAGYYNLDFNLSCDICPSNSYAREASSKCTPCPRGYVSSHGAARCSRCYGGYYYHDHSLCFHHTSHTQFYLLTIILPLSLFTILLLSFSWLNFGFAYTSVLSTFDLLSDLLYLTTTFFYNDTLFIFAVIFLFPGLFLILYDLAIKIHANKNSLRIFDHLATFLSKFHQDTLLWCTLAVISAFVWTLILVPYVVITLVIGFYLSQTKLLSLPYYERLWHSIYFSGTSQEGDTKEQQLPNDRNQEVNLHLLNKAILVEVWCEAIPQLLLQTINNLLLNSFGPVAQLSLATSILSIMNSYYRIFYFNVILGIPLKDIPTELKTPLTHLMTLKSKFEKIFVKKEKDDEAMEPFLDDVRRECINESLIIHFKKGPNGLIFAHQNGQIRVFRIDSDSNAYQSGVQKGYFVDMVNGAPASTALTLLTNNFFNQDIVVHFHAPLLAHLVVEVPEKICQSTDIGIVLKIQSGCSLELAYYQVTAVEENSLCARAGVRVGDRLLSVNGQSAIFEINRLMLESTVTTSKYFMWLRCARNNNSVPLVLIFQRPSSSWLDELCLQQEIVNNHLRRISLLLISTKKGVPYIGSFPLFFTSTLDNFGLLTLYLMTWLLIIILQFIWSSLWLVYNALKLPLMLPYIFYHLISHFILPFEFSQFLLWGNMNFGLFFWPFVIFRTSIDRGFFIFNQLVVVRLFTSWLASIILTCGCLTRYSFYIPHYLFTLFCIGVMILIIIQLYIFVYIVYL